MLQIVSPNEHLIIQWLNELTQQIDSLVVNLVAMNNLHLKPGEICVVYAPAMSSSVCAIPAEISR